MSGEGMRMMRDRDEWRRPWVEGATGLPVATSGAADPDATGPGGAF
jgi:hypothetical protein